MRAEHNRYKSLIIAGLISTLMIFGITNLSDISQKKSVLEDGRQGTPSVLSVYSLV